MTADFRRMQMRSASVGILRSAEFQNSADLKFLLIYLFLWDFNLWQQCQNYDALGQIQRRRPEENTVFHSRFTKGRA